jgi:hypothetical protein
LSISAVVVEKELLNAGWSKSFHIENRTVGT